MSSDKLDTAVGLEKAQSLGADGIPDPDADLTPEERAEEVSHVLIFFLTLSPSNANSV